VNHSRRDASREKDISVVRLLDGDKRYWRALKLHARAASITGGRSKGGTPGQERSARVQKRTYLWCITAWASASTCACNSGTDGVQAASASDEEEISTQDDGTDTDSGSSAGTVSAEGDDGSSQATGGVAGNTAASKVAGGVSGNIAASEAARGAFGNTAASETAAGVSGNTEAVKPKQKFTFIRIVIIVAISVGATLVLTMILSLVTWRCCSAGARRRRQNAKGSANGNAPAIPYPVNVARHDACDPYGPPPFPGAKSGHVSPYGYHGAPLASLP
jgi:hypothetical protein